MGDQQGIPDFQDVRWEDLMLAPPQLRFQREVMFVTKISSGLRFGRTVPRTVNGADELQKHWPFSQNDLCSLGASVG